MTCKKTKKERATLVQCKKNFLGWTIRLWMGQKNLKLVFILIRIFVGETYIVNGETFSEFICVKKSELLELLNDF